jgi:F-type H+-transporting ATPase subunit epsilon
MVVEILAPDQTVFSGEVKMITLPGKMGIFQILKDHISIIATLGSGLIDIKLDDGTSRLFKIDNGIVEAHRNQVSILVEGVSAGK